MCYDIAYMTKRAEKYAEHYRIEPSVIREEPLSSIPVHHVQAFAHPDIPVITNADPGRIQFFHWGLIPFWVKDVETANKLSKRTINARGEEMFEKPSFRSSAKSRRCLVVVDGFYEHHWKGGKSYPFFIRLKGDEPFSLAGLWDTWKQDSAGISRNSVTIVTCKANRVMSLIHNNPKGSHEPRMPLIIPAELEADWNTAESDELAVKRIREMVQPYDPDELEAHPVNRLRGKAYAGNVPEIQEPVSYAELQEHFWE